MAITLKFRVSDLFPEFLANTLIFLCPLQAAGTIATCALQAFPDGGDYFRIFIQTNCHCLLLPFQNLRVALAVLNAAGDPAQRCRGHFHLGHYLVIGIAGH